MSEEFAEVERRLRALLVYNKQQRKYVLYSIEEILQMRYLDKCLSISKEEADKLIDRAKRLEASLVH